MKKLFALMMVGSMALMACSESTGNGPENTGTSSPASKRVGEFKTKNCSEESNSRSPVSEALLFQEDGSYARADYVTLLGTTYRFEDK